MLNKRQSKIYGALLGAAIGDSMGAVSEGFAPEFLKERYNGYIKDLEIPTEDGMTVNSHRGMVSDDFSVAYYTAEVLLEHNSKINHDLAVEGLLRWWQHPEYTVYCGPSTRNGILQLIDPEKATVNNTNLKCLNGLVSNGSAMKSGMMGVFNPGDVDKAIDDAITMCRITHTNAASLAGATAIAAATAMAFKDVSYLEVIEAGIYGARQGYERTKEFAVPVSAPDLLKRINWALDIGFKYQGDFDNAMIEIADVIGSGLWVYEAVPAVLGMIAATKGELMETIYMAVNAGQDADSAACMAGYILGALHSHKAVPEEYLDLMDKANNFKLKEMALKIDALVGDEHE